MIFGLALALPALSLEAQTTYTPYQFVTLAGTAGGGGHLDATGPAAQFANPDGIAVDASGNVYVADTTNDTIRQITPGGVVTTIVGSAGVAGTVDGPGATAQNADQRLSMKHLLFSLSVAAAVALISFAPPWANSQQSLTWDQVKAKFEAANPALKADALGVDEMKAAEITAFLRPIPSS